MKSRSLLLMALVVGAGLLIWQVAPSWRKLVTDAPVGGTVATSTAPTTTTTQESLVEFLGDRRQPYVVEWFGAVGNEGIGWQLTIDEARVQGLAYTSTTIFDAYGSVATSTDSLLVTAYQPDGEVYAMASGTWEGKRFYGVVTREQATGTIRLLPTGTNQARLSFDTAKGDWTDARREMQCDYSLRMPVVEAANGVSRVAADQINAALRRVLLETGQTATQDRDAYLRRCRTELEEEARAWKGDGEVGGMFRRSLATDVTVTMNRAPYLSLQVLSYAYSGGAHGLTSNEGLVFDTRTGRRVAFGDLFRDQTTEPVARTHALIAQGLVDQYGDQLFDDNRAKMSDYAALLHRGAMTDLVRMWETGDIGFATTTNFYLVPGGVQVVFQQYEVAPYAVGMPSVYLPIRQWTNEAADAWRNYLSTR